MNNLILCDYIVYAIELSYKDADLLLGKMNNSPAAEQITFSMSTEGQSAGKWKVQGMVKSLLKSFLKAPENYVIPL